MNNSQAKKYRPVFSSQEIQVLSHILKTAYIADLGKVPYHPDYPNDHNRGYDKITQDYLIQLIAKVSTLEAKIANNALQPAYTSAPPKDAASTLESLGAAPETVAAIRGTQTKEQYWEECYLKFLDGAVSCTIPELDAAAEHRYLHDLMTPDELEVFESKMLPVGGTS